MIQKLLYGFSEKAKERNFGTMSKMDRKTFIVVTSICAAFVLVFALAIVLVLFTSDKTQEQEKDAVQEDIAGVWIASVTNIDFPSKTDLDADALRKEIDAIVETTAELGLNTIYFQVRPCADALYDSEIFPVSAYLSQSGELTLDALEYMIETANAAGISVHAWVNPLRVTGGGVSGKDTLPEDHPAVQHPEWVVEYADGKLYFDCGVPQVRELIAAGVKEIVDNYAVDGIIFDDYFYPYPKTVTGEDGETSIAAFADEETFSEYGEGYEDMGDWRRDNVNSMIRLVYDTIKEADADCLFGVAPFGVWKNGYGGESGSETRGAQSYSDIYCDTLAWVKGGYVDYIAPQIYWRTVDSAAPYDVLCDWWAEQVEDTDVRLLVCHAAYRYDSDWEDPQGIMAEQVAYAKEKASYKGSIFYGYEELSGNINGIADEVRALYTVDTESEKDS